MSRASSKRGKYKCPYCNEQTVSVSRASQQDPFKAVCANCGGMWEYVRVQDHGNIRELIASDGMQVVSLATVDKRLAGKTEGGKA